MDTPLIHFSYDGKKYTVAMTAYYVDLIRLPDGRLLQVYGWEEKIPPCPMHIQELDKMITLRGVEATEVTPS